MYSHPFDILILDHGSQFVAWALIVASNQGGDLRSGRMLDELLAELAPLSILMVG